MPKDESRRRVKERLRPYVKVWSPRKGFLHCSVITVFIAGSSCLWFDWQAADLGSQQEVYRWTFLGQSVPFWKSNINNNNCTMGDKYEVNRKWIVFHHWHSARLDADSALNHDLLWSDPMPCSLEKMLANHHQSMFEYNAPTRFFLILMISSRCPTALIAEEALAGEWLGDRCAHPHRTNNNNSSSSSSTRQSPMMVMWTECSDGNVWPWWLSHFTHYRDVLSVLMLCR